ncbi:multifunctional 2',3'-cyclic-nucleotide 2'-phosphodiesterase/5'-nucleotidase/3'-nucleotidase [Sinirhodobacter populi]|uniref:Multifunctional 2',3'-cyclic-nucleotide 2'-phosphodiesterase/5'-nucleotidase/3'-nucleotidase n=1 Tax=Paenirhodobacter populi TaxID=2306993 RepID=A0A443KQT9_9RHOB|nr:5'-nucleotidase C-terminal domain-containing protein [Sinirhodobacter populi]RWR35272.1 multifunctional 2',3'-cyclic-nucleotide 2'-phosphodiesterase/5'-nucleotidase/3'-nucleotidase [Sinirhodobacter populi]
MKIRFLMSTALSAALLLAAGAAQADYTLHILHTNDLHSRIEPIDKFDSTCDAETDAKGDCFGGVARIATKVAELREELAGQNVLLVDIGDQFQGSLFYTTYKGRDAAEFMNDIGYQVMILGNHEFDDGPAVLRDFVGLVDFPVISGNLDLSRSEELRGRIGRSLVMEIGGEKVGLVSALTTDTPEISSPGPNVIFQDDAESLKAQVEDLQAQGVTKIVALTHVGYTRDRQLAEQVPGLDAIVGGHSHTLFSNVIDGAEKYPTTVNEVPIVSAYAYSKYLGHLVLTFDDDGNLKSAGGGPILLDASVKPDPKIAARVEELAEPIAEVRARVVAEASAAIDGSRDTCRAAECQMGNLVADAMLDRVKDQGVTIAIENGGGLRASIEAGPVTMGDVLTVLPFQNTLSTFQARGSTMVKALENGLSQVEEGAGRFPQVAGLRFVWDPKAPAGERLVSVEVQKDGDWAPIEQDTVYGIVTNNYMRMGGDGYSVFAAEAEKAYDFGPDLADVTADYLAKSQSYTPYLDGRIRQVE